VIIKYVKQLAKHAFFELAILGTRLRHLQGLQQMTRGVVGYNIRPKFPQVFSGCAALPVTAGN
jgi:hypothetical protein